MDLASSRSVLVTGEKEILPTLERCVDLQNRYCNMGTQDKGTLDEKEADHRVEEEEEHQKEEGEEDEKGNNSKDEEGKEKSTIVLNFLWSVGAGLKVAQSLHFLKELFN